MKKKFTIERLNSGFIVTTDGNREAVEEMASIRQLIYNFIDACTARSDFKLVPIIEIEISETDNPAQVK